MAKVSRERDFSGGVNRRAVKQEMSRKTWVKEFTLK